MGKTINVTPAYRIVVADERNIIVERLTTILPPVGKPAPADFVSRQEYREIGSYGKTYSGLVAAIKTIVLNEAIDGLAPSTELAEFASSLRVVGAKIDTAFSPQITVSLAVLDVQG